MDNIIIDISDNDFNEIDLENLVDLNNNEDVLEFTAIFNSLKIINSDNSNNSNNSEYNNFSFYQGPNPSKYRDNFYNCYACNKKLLISKYELNEFFENNLEKRVNRKNLILMYRLFDECKFYIKFNLLSKFDNILKDINSSNTFHNSTEWNLMYEMYFNQQGLNLGDYIKCNICLYNFCPKHCEIAKFKYFKCKHCKKNYNICNWCKNGYEDELCYECE